MNQPAPFRPKPPSMKSGSDVLLAVDPNELVSQVERLGTNWADADEEANLLEETKKTLLAQLTMQQQAMPAGGKPLAMNAAETRAIADPAYKEHVENMVRKRGQANRLRVKYDSGKAKIELLRSVLATERAAMQISAHRT